jgi:hypothetical protein
MLMKKKEKRIIKFYKTKKKLCFKLKKYENN